VKISSNSYLLYLIKSHPDGIKEYDLLKKISEQNNQKLALFDSMVLFQQHFLLFHALYRLRAQQHAAQHGHIIIEALNIQWLPYSPLGQDSLTHEDPLRRYYLDLSNLEQTSAQDVDNLLAIFWGRFNQDSPKEAALKLFDLASDCDLIEIKKRYRQLLSSHHSDKGGSVDKTQSINEAMAVLKACYT
jgi:hypothetical protein